MKVGDLVKIARNNELFWLALHHRKDGDTWMATVRNNVDYNPPYGSVIEVKESEFLDHKVKLDQNWVPKIIDGGQT